MFSFSTRFSEHLSLELENFKRGTQPAELISFLQKKKNECIIASFVFPRLKIKIRAVHGDRENYLDVILGGIG